MTITLEQQEKLLGECEKRWARENNEVEAIKTMISLLPPKSKFSLFVELYRSMEIKLTCENSELTHYRKVGCYTIPTNEERRKLERYSQKSLIKRLTTEVN